MISKALRTAMPSAGSWNCSAVRDEPAEELLALLRSLILRPADFAAKADAEVVVADQAELTSTPRALILHELLLSSARYP
jgi:hypothetical protein